MGSLLDDTNRMLKEGYGDSLKLKHIKETLEQNRMLFVADRKYLLKLVRDHPESPKIITSKYEVEKKHNNLVEDDLNLNELEEKIRVDSEPS